MTLFAEELSLLREILLTAAACKKPDQAKFAELLSPLQVLIQKVSNSRDSSRKEKEWSNHFSVIVEGSVCVGWINIVYFHSFLCGCRTFHNSL